LFWAGNGFERVTNQLDLTVPVRVRPAEFRSIDRPLHRIARSKAAQLRSPTTDEGAIEKER
jgi:hypothetical protein